MSTELTQLLQASSPGLLVWKKSKPIKQLAQDASAPDQLLALATRDDTDTSLKYKSFLALYSLGHTPKQEKTRRAAATLYTQGMLGAEIHNGWGLPGNPEGFSYGLIALGKPALPALVPLLRNTKPLLYEGSEEPTLSELHQYRICDLAGRITADILGQSFPAQEQELALRDQALAKLHQQASKTE